MWDASIVCAKYMEKVLPALLLLRHMQRLKVEGMLMIY